MIFCTRECGREFLYPQLHHVMDFPFPFICLLIVCQLLLSVCQLAVTPRHKTNTCRKKIWGKKFFREYMRGLYSHSREYRKIFLRSHFLHITQILEGNYSGAYTCRACIRTRANTGKYSWGIIYVLVSCQGVIAKNGLTLNSLEWATS